MNKDDNNIHYDKIISNCSNINSIDNNSNSNIENVNINNDYDKFKFMFIFQIKERTEQNF